MKKESVKHTRYMTFNKFHARMARSIGTSEAVNPNLSQWVWWESVYRPCIDGNICARLNCHRLFLTVLH